MKNQTLAGYIFFKLKNSLHYLISVPNFTMDGSLNFLNMVHKLFDHNLLFLAVIFGRYLDNFGNLAANPFQSKKLPKHLNRPNEFFQISSQVRN